MRPRGDMLRGKRAAFFDLDGTLIDSIGVWNETDRILHRELTGTEGDPAALQAMRDEALLRFREEEDPYLCYCGLLRERYGAAMSAEQLYQRRYAIAGALQRDMDYKPGADQFLRALQEAGYDLVLTTTTRRRSLDTYRTQSPRIAAKAPLDGMFRRIYTCEDVRRIKPDPEIYLLAMADLGLAPAQCVVFEDSLAGVRAARAAGLEVCAIYDRHADPDREAINALAHWQAKGWPTLLAEVKMEEKRT